MARKRDLKIARLDAECLTVFSRGHFHRDYAPWERRGRIAAASGAATPSQVQARVDFYGGLCWICRTKPYEAMDHVKPIRRGGSLWPANLRPACKSCNSRKGAKWPFSREAITR